MQPFRFQLTNKTHSWDNTDARAVSNDQGRSKIAGEKTASSGSYANLVRTPYQRTAPLQQQYDNEHMSTLHSKLHQEADKIRKWKLQTEMELKAKDKSLKEASLRIQTMKKSLLELQIDNEQTSFKLQEEIGNREEILERINRTRDMCNLLRHYSSQMESRLTKCETEKTELKYLGKENIQNFEELTNRFKNLQIATIEKEQKIRNESQAKREEHQQKEFAFKQTLQQNGQEILQLKRSLEVSQKEIQDLQSSLMTKDKKLECMEGSQGELEQKNSCLHEELQNKEEELKESSLRISSILDEKSEVQKQLKGLELDFHSLQMTNDRIVLEKTENTRLLEEKLQTAVQEASTTQSRLEEEEKSLKECETRLSEATALAASLKKANDQLTLEKSEIEMHFNVQKYQIENLQAQREDDKEELHRLEQEIEALQKQIEREKLLKTKAQEEAESMHVKSSALMIDKENLSVELTHLKEQLCQNNEEKAELQENLDKGKQQVLELENCVNSLEKALSDNRLETEKLQETVDEYESNTADREVDQKKKGKEIMELQKEIEKLKVAKSQLEDRLENLLSDTEDLRSQVKEKDNEVCELKTKLTETTEEKSKSGKSLTIQQKKVEATAKENKTLEKELKALKIKLEKESKSLKEQREELTAVQEELSVQRAESEAAIRDKKEAEAQLKKEKKLCDEDRKASKLAMIKAEEVRASAQKEKDNALALTDHRLNEMMATLDKYKEDNEKLISDKEVEIKSLAAKLIAMDRLSVDKDQKLKELQTAFERRDKESVARESKLHKQMLDVDEENKNLKDKIEFLESLSSNSQSEQTDSSKKSTSKEKPTESSVGLGNKGFSPRTPLRQTPRREWPVTPVASILRTPQCSELKNSASSVHKKRKVAFAAEDDKPLPSSSEESDVMEIDTAALTKAGGTPLLMKSPKVRVTESSGKTAAKLTPNVTTPKTNLHQTPRSGQIGMESSREGRVQSAEGNKPTNLRKTPAKKTKFFTTSPKEKWTNSKTKIKEKGKVEEDSAWFNVDSVFGFDPED